jgi:hypothetical protein
VEHEVAQEVPVLDDQRRLVRRREPDRDQVEEDERDERRRDERDDREDEPPEEIAEQRGLGT